MSTARPDAAARGRHGGPRPADDERSRGVLVHGSPSATRSIAEALVVKDGDVFFLCEQDGRVPMDDGHGLGLYYHDCRFLSGYELTLAGGRPDVLLATAGPGFMARFVLTNRDIRTAGGDLAVARRQIEILWERIVDGEARALYDLIELRNHGVEPTEVPLALVFRAGFDDVFVVRGVVPEGRGEREPPAWRDGALAFRYRGRDGWHRGLTVEFSPAPDERDRTTARFRVPLGPKEARRLLVSLAVAEAAGAEGSRPAAGPPPDPDRVKAVRRRMSEEWLAGHAEVETDSPLLDAILDRSLRDLRALRTRLDGHEFFAAGVPWYVTLFGRDSLLTALETLAFDARVPGETLRLLARYQGERHDAWREEAPGKIVHELRTGELARSGEIPYTRYYGSVDATPLFLILLARQAAWTGDLALFHELRGHVERALAWLDGDAAGSGYVAYRSESAAGLSNQGWKDSGAAIVNEDGSLVTPPVALVEVQAYAYLARLGVADLFRRAGEPGRAERLEREAEDLRRRFERDFWSDRLGCYVLALQAGNRPAAVVSSNPGHALWAGIAAPERARRTAERLLAEDMFTGWGIRTLSARERRYNPIGYHQGTVWPHDNVLVAAGFRRYGLDDGALRVAHGLLDAASRLREHRLPEVFAGYDRADFGEPVRYPVACQPQAWAAGAAPYLVTTLLGLEPDGFERRLRIVRPLLPSFVRRLTLRRLAVGRGRTDLRFERGPDGGVAVRVLGVEGDLEVVSGAR